MVKKDLFFRTLHTGDSAQIKPLCGEESPERKTTPKEMSVASLCFSEKRKRGSPLDVKFFWALSQLALFCPFHATAARSLGHFFGHALTHCSPGLIFSGSKVREA